MLPNFLIETPAFSDNFFCKFIPDFVADVNAFTSNLLACANFLGLLIPLGLIVVYVLLDPHFRSARALQRQLPPDVELIGVVPHYRSPLSERLFKKDMVLILIVLSGSLVSYIGIAVFWHIVRS